MSERHEACKLRKAFALEAVEVGADEGASEFAGAVRTEVHEYDNIVIIDGCSGSANYCWFNEFIVFVACIGRGEGGFGIGEGKLGLATREEIIGGFDSVPTVIAIHGIEAPANRGDPATAASSKQCLDPKQRTERAARWRVTTIEKGMKENLLCTAC